MERGGVKIKDVLGRKDPWAATSCRRDDCMGCNSTTKKEGTPSTCNQEGVCYQISCDRCKQNNISAEYYGESARTTYLRGREHLKGQEKGAEDNPLNKHDHLHHQGVRGTYSMKVLRRHNAPLGRQIHEATEIELSKANVIMNSKGEFNGARVPRVTIEVGGKVLTGEYRGHELISQEEDEQQQLRETEARVTQWEESLRLQPTPRTSPKKRQMKTQYNNKRKTCTTNITGNATTTTINTTTTTIPQKTNNKPTATTTTTPLHKRVKFNKQNLITDYTNNTTTTSSGDTYDNTQHTKICQPPPSTTNEYPPHKTTKTPSTTTSNTPVTPIQPVNNTTTEDYTTPEDTTTHNTHTQVYNTAQENNTPVKTCTADKLTPAYTPTPENITTPDNPTPPETTTPATPVQLHHKFASTDIRYRNINTVLMGGPKKNTSRTPPPSNRPLQPPHKFASTDVRYRNVNTVLMGGPKITSRTPPLK